MNVIRFAIENPVKVTVAVLLLVLGGLVSILHIPIQLTPNVDRPRITVTTRWPGATPQEVESEIIDRQEEKLKGLSGLRKMSSVSRDNEGEITLEFFVGVDKDDALREVIEKINQVSDYPERVERPEIVAADAALDAPIAWMILRGPEGLDIATLRDFAEDEIRPILERVEGLERVDVYGGREREVQIRVDAARLAARGITYAELEAALRRQNANISAGTLAQGKREYAYRTIGEYSTVEEVLNTVIAYRSGGPVHVRDVATVVKSYRKPESFVRNRGRPVLAMPARREAGSNVIRVMEGLKQQIEVVNRDILAPRNMGLELIQVYDETTYIHSAIGLVLSNIVYGGILAIAVLVLFLRSGPATLVVAVSIPIAIIATFLMVTVLGRSLNVVMLAGMAFAVGMVVDNAIVVLENIFRHRQLGRGAFEAALVGAREVWGAVLASTLTTMAVFLPVIFVQEEAGQLFRDIAIAISVAVGLSLLVAITVIPCASARMLGHGDGSARRPPVSRFAGAVGALVERINRSVAARVGVVAGLTGAAIGGSLWLMPPATYLPTGNRNLVFGFLTTPPGYSLDTFRNIANQVEAYLRPFWEAEPGTPQADALPEVEMITYEDNTPRVHRVKPPPIANFFFVAFGGRAFMGATSKVPDLVRPLVGVLTQATAGIAGVQPFVTQTSLFGRALSSGNSIELEVRGHDIDEVIRVASQLRPMLMKRFETFPRASPENFDLGRPEVQAIPNRVRAADLGMSVTDVGFILEACVDGAFVGEFREAGDRIDLVVRIEGLEHADTTRVAGTPVFTPTGHVVPLSAFVDFRRVSAPQQINHIEQMPAVSLGVNLPESIPLEQAMQIISEEIVAPMRAEGQIPPSVLISLAGNADKLVQTRRALLGSYEGLVRGPHLVGLPVWASLGVLGGVVLAIAGIVGHLTTRQWGLRAAGAGCVALAAVFVAFNPAFVMELLQSRGVWALIITYLLMAALFESFLYPFVIMFSVPLAMVGGFAGLGIVHAVSLRDPTRPIQQLDVLTMLGFVILIGVVVNNAILVVHQALNNMREQQMPAGEALVESVRTRIRPIFMSTLTSVFGMLPLVVMPGAGSELYRGLGAVVVGGLLVSTVFTLLVVPALFSLLVSLRGWAARGREAVAVPAPGPAASPSHAVRRAHTREE